MAPGSGALLKYALAGSGLATLAGFAHIGPANAWEQTWRRVAGPGNGFAARSSSGGDNCEWCRQIEGVDLDAWRAVGDRR